MGGAKWRYSDGRQPPPLSMNLAVRKRLTVYSCEPVICHDSVDMGWNRLSDLCIHDGKLLGCSYYRNSVGVWVADISLTKPYAADSTPGQDDSADEKPSVKIPEIAGKVESGIRCPGLRCMSPDYDTKEIKNIYVDCSGGKPVASRRVDSPNHLFTIISLSHDS